jgi:hypothetical protein
MWIFSGIVPFREIYPAALPQTTLSGTIQTCSVPILIILLDMPEIAMEILPQTTCFKQYE